MDRVELLQYGPDWQPVRSIGDQVSATVEEPKSVVSQLDDFAKVSLADISNIGAPVLDSVIARVIPESHIKPIPVASFGSAI